AGGPPRGRGAHHDRSRRGDRPALARRARARVEARVIVATEETQRSAGTPGSGAAPPAGRRPRRRPGKWSVWQFNWLANHKIIRALERSRPHAHGVLLDLRCGP